MHTLLADVTEPTCVEVLQPGYRIGDRDRAPGAGRRRRARASADAAGEPTRRTTTRQHERRDADEHQGLPREGLLQVLGVPKDATAGRDQEGVPQARPASTTRTPTRATPRPRSGSRRSPRPTTCCPTPSAARSTTRRARCSAPAAAGRFRRPAARRLRRRPGRPVRLRRPVRRRRGGGGGGLGDVLGGLFGQRGGRPARRTRPRRGADVETEVTLRSSEAVEGVTVPLRLTSEAALPDLPRHRRPRPARCRGSARPATAPARPAATWAASRFAEPCRECHGRGLVVDDPCPDCHGSGRAMSTRTITVRIPAGVEDGQRIRLKGKGAPGERGGPAGDLYVTVHVAPHPRVRPHGRQPHADRAGDLRRGGARRRGQGADPRRARRSRCGSRRAPPTAARCGSRGKGVARKDGTRATCWSPSRSRSRRSCRRQGPRGASRRSATATAGEDPRAGLLERRRELSSR